MREWFARRASANDSSLSLFKQSLKAPIGMSNVLFPQCFTYTFRDVKISVKTVDICKSSIGMVGRRLSTTRPGSPERLSDRPSWETEILEEGRVPS